MTNDSFYHHAEVKATIEQLFTDTHLSVGEIKDKFLAAQQAFNQEDYSLSLDLLNQAVEIALLEVDIDALDDIYCLIGMFDELI